MRPRVGDVGDSLASKHVPNLVAIFHQPKPGSCYTPMARTNNLKVNAHTNRHKRLLCVMRRQPGRRQRLPCQPKHTPHNRSGLG